jgi:lantibiotic transport system permease protein
MLVSAFVIPFVLVFDYSAPDPSNPANGWDNYYREGFMVFAFLFLPFFYILSSTLQMQIEVRNNAWKQVLASPQSFFHILLAKYTVLHVLALVFIILFNAFMAIGCALIDLIYGINFLSYLNRWPELLELNLMAFGSSIGISALSFWLALRFKNFIAPIAIGILLWLIGPTAALELKLPHFDKYVFVLPFTIVTKKFEDARLLYQLLSLGYGLFFFTIAYLEFVLQRVQLSSFWRKKRKAIPKTDTIFSGN